MKISENITFTNQTNINSGILAEKCFNIHDSAIINGSINVIIKNNDNISITIEKNSIVEFNSHIAIKDSEFFLGSNAQIESNTSIKCTKSSFTIRSGSSIGFCSKVKLDNTNFTIGRDSLIGDFTKVTANKGLVTIGDACIIGDYCLLDSSPGTITIENCVKIDSHNELIATGDIFIGAKSHLWNGIYMASFDKPFILSGQITLGQKCIIAGRGKLKICDGTMIGGATYIVTESHNFEEPFNSIRNQSFTTNGVFIDGQSWISAKCTILDGVRIGYRTIIGAGALVNKDIPSYKLAIGIPAKVYKDRRDDHLAFLQTKTVTNQDTPEHYTKWLKTYSHCDIDSLSERLADKNESTLTESSAIIRENINLLKRK